MKIPLDKPNGLSLNWGGKVTTKWLLMGGTIGILWASLLIAQPFHNLPNPQWTPGLTRALTKDQICNTKWGQDERKVTQRMKVQVCVMYGITSGCPGKGYEIDHLISRELGGADDIRNLWPEPQPDAHTKDVVENWTHNMVCSGQMSLDFAQHQIATNWTVLLELYQSATGAH